MKPQDLRTIIQQALQPISLWTPDVEELLLFTSANESHLGQYRHQINGPALGIYQMEPNTITDIWNNYLRYHQYIVNGIHLYCDEGGVMDVETNDHYATILARVQYLRAPEAIPSKDDLEGIWSIYKLRYNTPLGGATRDVAMECYKKYVLDLET